MELGDIRDILPGDAVMIRTGWNQLLKRVNRQTNPSDIARWSASRGMPGIYIAEGQFLLTRRPALVASDTWALEVLGSPSNIPGTAFPVHQDLIMRGGIRIGESVSLDGLADDGVYEFVYMVTPQFAEGATCANTAPAALGQPR
jgi:kynurenine formamidase